MELLLFAFLPLLAFGVFGGGNDSDDGDGGGGGGGGGDPDTRITRGDDDESLQDGGSGSDLMLGAGGVDRLSGMEGNDVLVGETGADDLRGDEGDDIVLGGWGEDLMYGGDGEDVMVGGTGDDTMYGGAESDLMLGSSGADTIVGDDGDDVLIGYDPRSDLSPEELAELDTAALEAALADVYGSDLRDSDVRRVVTGIVTADATDPAADLLQGGRGADELLGDRGDTLTGGEDTDAFTVYNRDGDAAPTITDFNAATESLVILVDGPANGTISYVNSTGGLLVRLDGDVVAVLQGITASALLAGSIEVQSAA